MGALIPILLLPCLDEGMLILISAVAPLIPAAAVVAKKLPPPDSSSADYQILRKTVLVCSLATIAIVVFILTSASPSLIQVTPTPYKALGQILQFPDTRILESRSGIRGRIDRVQTPYVRFAPGLSLNYARSLPRQEVIYKDGDSPLVLYDLARKEGSRFAADMLSFAGYWLNPKPADVLLIQQGGGSAVPCALAADADRITVIEQNPSIVEILRRNYPGLHVINQDPRVFLAQSKTGYDIIQIENWGAPLPGAAALNQEHVFTIEAFEEYWTHLKPGGVISASRKLLLPPSDSLRLWSTVYETLWRLSVREPRDHLAVIRNFDTFTLLISKEKLDVPGLIDFASSRNFDLVFLRGMARDMANQYHAFPRPFHHLELNRLADAWKDGRQNEYFDRYLLDIRPQSDRRPFPGRFIKWSRVKQLYKSLGDRFYALFLSGEVVIAVVFGEALLLSIFLLILPVVFITGKINRPTFPQTAYFFGIGAGFMFVELYLIKYFILLLGDPTISFALVVSAVLIFSSLGGLYTHSRIPLNIRPILPILIIGLILATTGLELIADSLLKLSKAGRYLIALLFMLPIGFLMGIPFPLGMRYLLENPIQRAYAWSVNGCASVLSAIIAAQLAISVGIPAIAIAAIAGYLLALMVARKIV
jgi:spermidine synthase